LDIGCAQGYFTKKAAEEGLLTLGIDNNEAGLSYAQKKWGFKSNLGFAHWDITPENVQQIPSADTILFLTVYHHFVKSFGVKNAKYLLNILGEKTNILVCEMPGDRLAGLSFKYTCTNIKTDETVTFTDYQKKGDLRAKNTGRIRPRFDKYLSPGTYEVNITAPGFKSPKPFNVTILNSGRLGHDRHRVSLEENKLKVIPGKEDDPNDINDIDNWYRTQLEESLGESINIIDKHVTSHKGENTKRRDVIYIVDVSTIGQ